MLTLETFQSLSLSQQRDTLVSLIGDIETTTNKQLLVCQKLLAVIQEPTEKLLIYIYEVIQEQLNIYTDIKQKSSQASFDELKAYISHQEFLEKSQAEEILSIFP
jgi:hypothetical protein